MTETRPAPLTGVTFEIDVDANEIRTIRTYLTTSEENAQRVAGSLEGQMGRKHESPIAHDTDVTIDGCEVSLMITAYPEGDGEVTDTILGSIARCVDELYSIAAKYDVEEMRDLAWFNYQEAVE